MFARISDRMNGRRKLNARVLRALLVGVVTLGGVCLLDANPCHGAIFAFLTKARDSGSEQFQTDLMFAGSADMVGDDIELVNLDIFNSTVNSVPLSGYSRVRFDAAPVFLPWHDGTQFGDTVGSESVITLDSFATVTALPFTIADTNPFRFGTFTFDYQGLGLQIGDTITLDLLGRDDGTSTRTTSIAVRPSGTTTTLLIDPDFSSLPNAFRSSFTLTTAIPEPSGLAVLVFAAVGLVSWRRSRRGV